MNRRRALVVAVVAALAVLGGGLLVVTSGSSGDEEAPPPDAGTETTGRSGAEQDTDTTTSTAPPAGSVPANEEVDLLTTFLPDESPLPGFRRADALLGAGPLDLEAAARAESDVEAERGLLETRHFVAGVSRAWTDDDGDVVYVAVYSFADAGDAAFYLRDGTETLLARAAQEFVVPAIPGAVGFTTVDDDDQGAFTSHAVAFASANRWVLTVVGSRSSSRTPDDARAVAADVATRFA